MPANEHMERCSASLVLRERKTRITRRYHYTPVKWLKLKRTTIPSTGRDVGKQQLPSTADGKATWYNHTENSSAVLLKVIHLPEDPAIPIPGICPRETKAFAHTSIQVRECSQQPFSYIFFEDFIYLKRQ